MSLVFSKGIDIAKIASCDCNRIVVNNELLTGRKIATSIGVLPSKLHKSVSEVSVMMDRLPAVIDSLVVVHGEHLLGVELCGVERILLALH